MSTFNGKCVFSNVKWYRHLKSDGKQAQRNEAIAKEKKGREGKRAKALSNILVDIPFCLKPRQLQNILLYFIKITFQAERVLKESFQMSHFPENYLVREYGGQQI